MRGRGTSGDVEPSSPVELQAELAEFLVKTLDEAELRRFLVEVEADLPGRIVTPRELAHASVGVLARQGRLDVAFFEGLCRLRPRLQSRVGALAGALLGPRWWTARARDDANPGWQPEFAHPLIPARYFEGRISELDELETWLLDTEAAARVIVLSAVGGTGKTAMVERLLARIDADELRGGLFVWSLYEERSADLMIERAVSYLGAGQDHGSLADLVDLLRTGPPHLLVLDGLEVVQHDGSGREPRGALSDRSLRLLLRTVAHGAGRSRILVTSRFAIPDLEPWEERSVRHLKLEDLAPDAAAAVLAHWGVRGGLERLRALANGVGCHALSVAVLGSYLGAFCGGDPDALPLFDLEEEAGHDLKAAKLHRILNAYAAVLDPLSLDLVTRLAVFPRGATAELLQSLGRAGGEVAGALALVTGPQAITACLIRLAQLGIVYGDETTGRYSAHPFVRDFFARRLGTESSKVHKAAHQGLALTLWARPGVLPSDKQRLDRYESLVEAACLAGDWREAAQVFLRAMGGYAHLGEELHDQRRGLRILSMLANGGGPEGLAAFAEPVRLDLLIAWAQLALATGDTDLALACILTVGQDLSRSASQLSTLCQLAVGAARLGHRQGRMDVMEQLLAREMIWYDAYLRAIGRHPRLARRLMLDARIPRVHHGGAVASALDDPPGRSQVNPLAAQETGSPGDLLSDLQEEERPLLQSLLGLRYYPVEADEPYTSLVIPGTTWTDEIDSLITGGSWQLWMNIFEESIPNLLARRGSTKGLPGPGILEAKVKGTVPLLTEVLKGWSVESEDDRSEGLHVLPSQGFLRRWESRLQLLRTPDWSTHLRSLAEICRLATISNHVQGQLPETLPAMPLILMPLVPDAAIIHLTRSAQMHGPLSHRSLPGVEALKGRLNTVLLRTVQLAQLHRQQPAAILQTALGMAAIAERLRHYPWARFRWEIEWPTLQSARLDVEDAWPPAFRLQSLPEAIRTTRALKPPRLALEILQELEAGVAGLNPQEIARRFGQSGGWTDRARAAMLECWPEIVEVAPQLLDAWPEVDILQLEDLESAILRATRGPLVLELTGLEQESPAPDTLSNWDARALLLSLEHLKGNADRARELADDLVASLFGEGTKHWVDAHYLVRYLADTGHGRRAVEVALRGGVLKKLHRLIEQEGLEPGVAAPPRTTEHASRRSSAGTAEARGAWLVLAPGPEPSLELPNGIALAHALLDHDLARADAVIGALQDELPADSDPALEVDLLYLRMRRLLAAQQPDSLTRLAHDALEICLREDLLVREVDVRLLLAEAHLASGQSDAALRQIGLAERTAHDPRCGYCLALERCGRLKARVGLPASPSPSPGGAAGETWAIAQNGTVIEAHELSWVEEEG